MQRTRINIVLAVGISRITEFFVNPWRKLSLIFICLLFGFFMASAIASVVGQRAHWDIAIALFCLIFIEFVSIIFYGRRNKTNQLLSLDLLNSFKLGFTYGLFLEALKLNS
jgi:hypothetical protein